MPKNQEISNRIAEICGNCDLTQTDIADLIGIRADSLSRIKRGKAGISYETAEVIEDELGYRAEWIMSGKEPKRVGDEIRSQKEGAVDLSTDELLEELSRRVKNTETVTVQEPVLVWGDRAKVERHEALDNYRTVPLMASAAAAGHGRVIDEEIESWAIIHESIVPEGHEVRAVRVEGDSMKPLLPEGTIVAVDLSVDDPASVDGHMAVAQRDSEVVIKWWMCHDHCVTLESENSAYGAIVLEPGEEENALIGQVVWAWQDLRDLRRHQ